MKNPVITVDVLNKTDELWTLENAFLQAVGEPPMEKENFHRLVDAMEKKQIVFFAARANDQLVGICSISPCFSTFACKLCGVFDDFFVAPEYRGQGVARKLVDAVRLWGKEHDCASLIVGCAPKDIAMYQSLGFDTELGTMLANNL